jgi:hypothetical protein
MYLESKISKLRDIEPDHRKTQNRWFRHEKKGWSGLAGAGDRKGEMVYTDSRLETM